MSTYRAATGSDVALGSLTVLSPQPDPGPIIQTTRRTYGGDGSVYDEGRYVELPWSALDDASAYTTILTVFGLSASTAYANVTIYVRDEVFAWVRMNGVAVRPQPPKELKWGAIQRRPLDIAILIKNLATAAPTIAVSDSISIGESVTVA